jgi:two-component system sensor histidine kinase KdpD
MSEIRRPDPDALLERIRSEEKLARRAKLKIFFGASAGVGKTYAMLVEAHERRQAGVEVVAGLVETHGRRETAALLEGLETLPRKIIEYRGTQLAEFDLDAALARKPRLLLLDELAHTNAQGSRHRRRWQDVEELLDSGIDVFTTLNVQHVESLRDVVAQITGVTVRETVPDGILARADEIELVDLPPEDLLQRLREGKVYVPAQAERAIENFFRKGNLIALRELALRQTAQRVDAQMESYRRAQGIAQPWAVRERILVCIGDPESGLRLVRAARRMASALKAEWIVVHVETPGQVREGPAVRDHIVDVLGLAEDLGAETAMLTGLRVSDEIVAFARERNVSRIVVGRPSRPLWQTLAFGSLTRTLMLARLEADVFVLRGEEEERAEQRRPGFAPTTPWRGYAGAIPVVLTCTAVVWLMSGRFDLSNLSMAYLLGVVVVAMAFGRGPAILSALLSVVLFDFLFVPPRFTLAISDTQYFVTFGVMLVVGVVIGTLAARMREQTAAARARERRTAAIYQLSRDLAGQPALSGVLKSAVDRIAEMFEARVAILRPHEAGRLRIAAGDAGLLDPGAHELGVAQWAFDHEQPAGLGTETLPASQAMHLPLIGPGGPVGVLAVRPADATRLRDPERVQLLRTFANHLAVALERVRLGEDAERARVEAEAERTRSALLSSVSHDLRTPLAVITGAASSLKQGDALSEPTRAELADTIYEEGRRLNRLVGDLLDVTRLESGAVAVNKDWHSLEEIVGATLTRLEERIGARPLELRLPDGLPLVPLDDVLFGQLVENLIENALKYAPEGSPIELAAALERGTLSFEVADRGPGLPPGDEERVFEKFFRGPRGAGRPGVGLGLTICRAIAHAHGGRIVAANRAGGGAVFRVELPVEGEPPEIEREEPGSAPDGADA